MKDILHLLHLLELRTAIVTAGISSGAVTEVFLNNDGSGYQTAPTITFSAPPVGGVTATAVGYNSCCERTITIK